MQSQSKDHESIVTSLRKELTNGLLHLVVTCHGGVMPAHLAIRASAYLRLYCALKAIATIR